MHLLFLMCFDAIISSRYKNHFPIYSQYEIYKDEEIFYCGIASVYHHDVIVPPNRDCYEGYENDPGSWGYQEFCLGDTTRFTVKKYFDYLKKLPKNEEFYPNRLLLKNGEVVRYSDSTFDIVWTRTGTDRLIYRTYNGGACESNFFHDIKVNPTNKIIIKNKNEPGNKFCKGEEIEFYIESGATNFLWRFSDGFSFIGTNIKHRFNNKGIYKIEVSEIVSAENECNCVSKGEIIIEVLDGEFPSIDCIGPVCSGDEITYYSENKYSTYQWSVSNNGQIIEGGTSNDSYAKVKWLKGLVGVLTLDGATELSDQVCKNKVTELIPVIDKSGEIMGPKIICYEHYPEKVVYKAPFIFGASYKWFVNNKLQPGNSFTHHFYPGTIGINRITVVYDNCFLNCEGEASLDIHVIKKFFIKTESQKICKGSEASFQNNLGIIVNWEIIDPDGQVNESQDSVARNIFTKLGNYRIVATNPEDNTCNRSDTLIVQVLLIPNKPLAILGDFNVCGGLDHKYSIQGLSEFENVKWTIYDGDSTNSIVKLAKEIVYKWRANNIGILKASIVDSRLGCESEIMTQYMQHESVNNFADTVCLGIQKLYTINTLNEVDVKWKIIGDSSGVINNNGKNIEVLWTRAGNHQLIASYCNSSSIFNVTVVSPIVIDVPNISICKGDYLKAEQFAALNNYVIEIFDENKLPIDINDDSRFVKGNYVVKYTSRFGCSIEDDFTIDEFQQNKVNIISNATAVCENSKFAIISVENALLNWNYSWYRDNKLIQGNNSSISVDKYGIYDVIVTDNNGCTSRSNSEILGECCAASFIPSVDLNLKIDEKINSCLSRSFEIVSPYLSKKINWNISKDKNLIHSFEDKFKIDHNFNLAGEYLIEAVGDTCEQIEAIVCGVKIKSNLCESDAVKIVIPHVANFTFDKLCSKYTYQFYDKSSIHNKTAGLQYNWNFDDVESGVNNSSRDVNPKHTFSKPGKYKVKLILEDITNCITFYELEVNVIALPDFIIESNNSFCELNKSKFKAIGDTSNYKFIWNFGDSASGSLNASKGAEVNHYYINPGNYIVSLFVNDNSCNVDTIKRHIIVVKNTLKGKISIFGNLPKCITDTILLSATSGYNYLWSDGQKTGDIYVTEAKSYFVKLIDSVGCEYTTPPIAIKNFEIGNVEILAYDNREQEFIVKDSIDVCLGDAVQLKCSHENLIYKWSFSNENKSTLSHTFALGRHKIVLLASKGKTCKIIAKPFIVNVRALPKLPELLLSDNNTCASIDKPVTIFIKDALPDHKYSWQNEAFKDARPFTVSSPFNYKLRVKNQYGCISNRNVDIKESPKLNTWISGCREFCFSKSLCINLNVDYKYKLIKNENIIKNLDPLTPNVVIDDPGDYKLQISNSICTTETEILSISAKPENQSVEGVVFFDKNQSLIFEDGFDSLMSNVKVFLLSNHSKTDSTTTDAKGKYFFKNIKHTQCSILLDPLNESLNHQQVDSFLLFDNCNESKELNFPLNLLCSPKLTTIRDTICEGENILFNGINYNSSVDLKINLYQTNGCDSIVLFKLVVYRNPNITILTKESCHNQNNGAIIINDPIVDYIYKLNADVVEPVDNEIRNLGNGVYNFQVIDKFGCVSSSNVEIQTFMLVNPKLDIKHNCYAVQNSELTVKSSQNLVFSVDDSVHMTFDTLFKNISTGSHFLYFKDVNDCNGKQFFNIEEYPQPDLDISVNKTCSDKEEGIVFVKSKTNDLLYSIDDSINMNSDTLFYNLNSGLHTLYIKDINGCKDNKQIYIEEYAKPNVILSTKKSCLGKSEGSLTVTSDISEIIYSIDDSLDYTINSYFDTLSIGDHFLHFKDNNGCFYKEKFTISGIQLPKVKLDITPSCENEKGQLIITPSEDGYVYTLDNDSEIVNSSVINATPGTHMLKVKSKNGCLDSMKFEVETYLKPQLEFSIDISCEGNSTGKITISGNLKDIVFSLDGITFTSDSIINELSKGTYQLFYKGSEGCEHIDTFEVEEYKKHILEINSNPSCVGENNGSIALNNLFSDYTYILNEEIVFFEDNSIKNLSKGLYFLQILDNNGCSTSSNIEIQSFSEINPHLELIHNCYGGLNSELKVNSNQNLLYSVDDSIVMSIDTLFKNIEKGMHTLYFKDINGCRGKQYFEIEEYNQPPVDLLLKESCKGKSEGAITMTSGISDLLYSIDDSLGYKFRNYYDSLSIGNHVLFYKDNNDCIYKKEFNIGEMPLPKVELDITSACENNKWEVIITASEIGYNYTLDNEFGIVDSNIIKATPGLHMLQIKSKNGCEDSMKFEIGTYLKPHLEFSMDKSCEGGSTGGITISGDVDDNMFSLDGITFSDDNEINHLGKGIYQLFVKTAMAVNIPIQLKLIYTKSRLLKLKLTLVVKDKTMESSKLLMK